MEAVYDGKSLPLLISVISGQDRHPLDFYVGIMDTVFLKCLIAGLLSVLSVFFILKAILPVTVCLRRRIRPALEVTGENRSGNLAGGIVCLLGGVLLIVGVVAVRHRFFVKSLDNYSEMTAPEYAEREFPGLSRNESINLGWAHTRDRHPESSYLKFARDKEVGTVRIGIFGCSFVQGSETAPGYDFPSLLRAEFKSAGLDSVEVINFGVASYGIHQLYLMWRYLGRQYDLDHVVFYPFWWHRLRDSRFSYHVSGFGSIHARFVADKDRLRLVPVAGNTRREAREIYFKAVPRWRYLRYDHLAPAFLRALLPGRPGEVTNPFYHAFPRSRDNEILDTYSLIFSALSRETKSLVIVANDRHIYGLKHKLSSANMYVIPGQLHAYVNSFLYRAPLGHLSALGNRLRACELFAFITGKRRPSLDFISVGNRPEKPSPSGLAKPLYEYADISVNIMRYPAASFVFRSKSEHIVETFDRKPDFRKQRISSLMQQTEAETVRFIPLPFLLNDGDIAYVSFKLDDESVRVPIGVVDAVAGVTGRISVESRNSRDEFAATGPGWSLVLADTGLLTDVTITAKKQVNDVLLAIGDKKVLEGVQSGKRKAINLLRKVILLRKGKELCGKFNLKPVFGEPAYLRAGPEHFVRVEDLDRKDGVIDLVLTREDGVAERYPMLLEYRVTNVICSPFGTVYGRPVTCQQDSREYGREDRL